MSTFKGWTVTEYWWSPISQRHQLLLAKTPFHTTTTPNHPKLNCHSLSQNYSTQVYIHLNKDSLAPADKLLACLIVRVAPNVPTYHAGDIQTYRRCNFKTRIKSIFWYWFCILISPQTLYNYNLPLQLQFHFMQKVSSIILMCGSDCMF